MNIHVVKKWPEKVVQSLFIKGHSFRNSLYEAKSVLMKIVFSFSFFLLSVRVSKVVADHDDLLTQSRNI